MSDRDFYIDSYVYGLNLSYPLNSDTVFRAADVVDALGLGGSVNPQLLAADPTGEVELSAALIVTTGTSLGDASKSAGFDVYRVFAPGSYSFAADGKVSGQVYGVVLVRSDETFEGAYFSTPIDLDAYSKRPPADLIAGSDGSPVASLEAFRAYLPSGWQRDPFAPDLVSVGAAGVGIPGDGLIARVGPIESVAGPDRILLGPTAFSRDSADRITDFDPDEDRLLLDRTYFDGLKGSSFHVIESIDPLVGSSRAERKAYKKSLKAQKKSLKRMGRGGESFIYNQASGELIFDQNGARKGFGTGGVFAIFADRPLLNAGCFEFV